MTAKRTEPEVQTVIHPTIDGVSYEVPAVDVDEWEAAGWKPKLPNTSMPAKSSPRETWVAFAVEQGAEADTADGMTKTELIETFGN